MPSFNNLPIMPKEIRSPKPAQATRTTPYPSSGQAAPRGAAIWNAADDEKLLTARREGLNWQPIQKRYFPNKTPNACRKRHERLVERRQVDEDWDIEKMEQLAKAYTDMKKDFWDAVGRQINQKGSVCEQKCFEKGLKNLHRAERSARARAAADGRTGSFDEQGISADCHRDSGIELGSDAEMEVDDERDMPPKGVSSTWHARDRVSHLPYQEHARSHSLPQPLCVSELPLFEPPPPPLNAKPRRTFEAPMTRSPTTMSYIRHGAAFQSYLPEPQNARGGVSIQSMLSPADPPHI